jgi:hypothetical protein
MVRSKNAISLGVSAIIIIVLILVVGFGVYLNATFNASSTTYVIPITTRVSGTLQITSSTSSGSYVTTSNYQESLNSTSGLRLDLFVAYSNGSLGSMAIRVDEYNTLESVNNVSTAIHWKYSSDSMNPFNDCGANGPIGFAILQGYYDLSNYTSGKALLLYNTTYSVTCTSTFYPVRYYLFNPQSDVATAYSAYGVDSPLETNASVSLSFMAKGYWTGGQYLGTQASFHYLASGTYTVVGADEWGKVVIEHFIASGSGFTSTTTSKSLSQSTG